METANAIAEGRTASWRTDSPDLWLMLLLALLTVGLAAPGSSFPLLVPLQVLIGLANILYVPGYCMTAALFPRRGDLDWLERQGLSLGLSFAIVPILALLLDRLPWGVRTGPVLMGELGLTLTAAGAALWRRSRLPVTEAYVPDPAWRPRPWWRTLPRLEKRVYGLIAALLGVAGLVAVLVSLVPSPSEFYTEFYMLGPEGLAESFPRTTAVGEELGVTLGIRNLEREVRSYRVEAWVVDPWSDGRRQLVAQHGPYEMEVGSWHEWPIKWRVPWSGVDQVVEILLFDGASVEPYRNLRLWLDVTD